MIRLDEDENNVIMGIVVLVDKMADGGGGYDGG